MASCAPSASEPAGEEIACALKGDVDFKKVCLLERNANELTVIRPDGGFRRIEMLSGGAFGVLDGAEYASVIPRANGETEIAIGGDIYRLPANVSRR